MYPSTIKAIGHVNMVSYVHVIVNASSQSPVHKPLYEIIINVYNIVTFCSPYTVFDVHTVCT